MKIRQRFIGRIWQLPNGEFDSQRYDAIKRLGEGCNGCEKWMTALK